MPRRAQPEPGQVVHGAQASGRPEPRLLQLKRRLLLSVASLLGLLDLPSETAALLLRLLLRCTRQLVMKPNWASACRQAAQSGAGHALGGPA